MECEEVLDHQTTMEIFESEMEDLKLEVAFLRKMIAGKNIEHGKMKMQCEKQKIKITNLAKLVSDLKTEMKKIKASEWDFSLCEYLDSNNNSTIQLDSVDENLRIPGDKENDNCELNTEHSPMPTTSENVNKKNSPKQPSYRK